MSADSAGLRWQTLATPITKDARALADGEKTVAVLDLGRRAARKDYWDGPPTWAFTEHTQVIVLREGPPEMSSVPALDLVGGGHDEVAARIVLIDREAWNKRLRYAPAPGLYLRADGRSTCPTAWPASCFAHAGP